MEARSYLLSVRMLTRALVRRMPTEQCSQLIGVVAAPRSSHVRRERLESLESRAEHVYVCIVTAACCRFRATDDNTGYDVLRTNIGNKMRQLQMRRRSKSVREMCAAGFISLNRMICRRRWRNVVCRSTLLCVTWFTNIVAMPSFKMRIVEASCAFL